VRIWCALAAAALLACTGSLDSKLAEVRQLHGAGDFAGSIEPLRAILSRDPNLAEANYLLGIALVQTGKPVLATVPLEKAAVTDDFGVAAGTLLSAVLASRQQHAAAGIAAQRVLERDPDNVLALQVHAASSLRTGDTETALENAKHAVEISPAALQARVLEAVALDRLGRQEEAAQAETRLFETARAAGQNPAEVRSCTMLALLHNELGDNERAIRTIDGCLQRFPTEPFLLQQAASLYDVAGRSSEGTRLWETAARVEPDNPILRSLLAERLARQGRAQEAEAILVDAADRFGDVRSLTQLARFYQQRGDFERATAATERALAKSPTPPTELRVIQTELLIDRGELEAAEAQIEEIDVDFYRSLLRGRLWAARGEDHAALEALEEGLAQGPPHPGARYLAGTIAERLGLVDKAILHYREAVANDPGLTDAPIELARLLMARGQLDQAAAMIAIGLATRPGSAAKAEVLAARIEAARGHADAANAHLEKLAQMPDQRGRALLERAALAARDGGPEAAVSVIQQGGLDLLDPENTAVLRELAENLVNLGRGEEAMKHIDAALKRSPDSAALYDARARVLFRLGRFDQARAAFREALRVSPDYASALSGLGRLAAQDGNLEEAIALLDRAYERSVHDTFSALLAAQLVQQQGRTDEAEQRMRTILRNNPADVGALNDLAWLLASESRDLDTALDLAERATRLDPRPEVLDTLGWVRLQRGEPGLALAPFERALSADPDAASILYRMGLALERLGRNEPARDAFRKALGAGDFPEAEEARAALSRIGAS